MHIKFRGILVLFLFLKNMLFPLKDFATVMLRLYDDPKWASSIGSVGQYHVSRKFDRTEFGVKLSKICQEVLKLS